MKIQRKIISTPLGKMMACGCLQGICLLEFLDGKGLEKELNQISKILQAEIENGTNEHINLLEKELTEYFKGNLLEFSTPLFSIGTDFQKSVWEVLQNIPYGTTISYQQQANLLQNPKAIRAVASANGQNKIAILIPCHRVIGSNGNLTGYAGGLWRKQKLLELEKAILL